jgi:hypothetical protein
MGEALRTYRILILPPGRIAATGLALNEAAAWISTYNAIMEDQPLRAVVDEELSQRALMPGVRFPLKTPPLRRFAKRHEVGTKRAA